ncbi:MAG: single-stranded DNA-binding protein [Patescibacteria group bacterium]
MNINKALICGNTTRDPEVKTTPNGHNVATFSVATNRAWVNKTSGQKQEEVDFHNIVAWGRLAEIVGQYLKKGGLVFVEGRIHTRSWEDQGGVKKYRTEIIAERIQLGPRSGMARDESTETGSAEIPEETEQNKTEEEINVDEIPF